MTIPVPVERCWPRSRLAGCRGAVPPWLLIALVVFAIAVALLVWWLCRRCDAECEQVVSVAVVPRETRAELGVTFLLLAVARDRNGEVIPDPPRAKWSGDVEFSDRRTNPASVTVAGARAYRVRAKIGRVVSPDAVVVVDVAGTVEVPRDEVGVEQSTAVRPAHALLDAKAVGDLDCQGANDRLYAVAGRAVLPENLTSGCVNELALFATDRAVLVQASGDLPPNQWTDQSDFLSRPNLPPTIRVPLAAWYFVAQSAPDVRANREIEEANWIYRENLAGLEFSIERHHLMGVDRSYIGDEFCSNVQNDLGFTADASRLNVVYVAQIAWNSDPFGWSCKSAAGRGDIIILSWSRPLVTTLAHELAHQLGLSSPPFPWNEAGHVDGYPGFDPENLMLQYGDARMKEDRFRLTLGQVYRLHVAQQSWINRNNARPSGPQKSCPGNATSDGLCPQLSLDGWRP